MTVSTPPVEKTQRWVNGGRPVTVSWRVTGCPTPTWRGMLVLRIWGLGSSTTTVLVIEVQPAALQAWSVTCLVPGVEKLAVGFCAVEIPRAWTLPASRKKARHDGGTLRKAGRGRE